MSAPRIRSTNSPAHQVNDAHDPSGHGTSHTGAQSATYYKAYKYANSRGRINKPVNRRLKNLRRRSRSSPQNDTEGDDLGYGELSNLEEEEGDELGKIQESAMGGSNLGGLKHNDQGDLLGLGEDHDKNQQATPDSLHTSQLLAALQRKKRVQPRKSGTMQDLENESNESLNHEPTSEIEDRHVKKAEKSGLDDFSTHAESTETAQSFSTHRTQKSENVKDPSQEEEMKVPTVRPTNLQLALPEQQSTLSARLKKLDSIPAEQRAAYVLNQSIQALMNMRDTFAKDPARASLRASIQALILRLLRLRLSKKLFTPMDLTSIRQILIDADEQRKQAQEQEEQEGQEERQKEESKAQKDKEQPELPQKVKTLNLLMPLLLLNSERPSTNRQLKRSTGRIKMLIRTAVKKTPSSTPKG